MKSKENWLVLLMPLLITACSDSVNTRYKDTSHLEIPPVLVIAEQPKQATQAKEVDEKTGLGRVVSLSGPTAQPILKIKKIFDRSWNIVEQGLNLSEIEITDKNRDKGVFYVKFDPDQKSSKDSGVMDNLSFFFFKDEYEEAAYKLTVQWRDSDTEVSVERIEQDEDSLLDDGEDDFENPIDSGAMLINALYKTIRDDLPLD